MRGKVYPDSHCIILIFFLRALYSFCVWFTVSRSNFGVGIILFYGHDIFRSLLVYNIIVYGVWQLIGMNKSSTPERICFTAPLG